MTTSTATAKVIRLKVDADTSAFKKAIKEAFSEAGSGSKQAGKQIESGLGSSAQKVARVTRQLGRDLRTVGGGLGPLSSGLGTVTRTLGSMATGMVAAGGAAGPAGLAVAGVGLAGVAAVGGIAAAGKAVVALGQNAARLRRELEPFYERGLLPPVDVGELDRAEAALDAVGSALKAVAVSVASEFAPAIESGSTLVVAFALAISDLAQEAGEILEKFTAWHEGLSGAGRVALGLVTAGTSDLVASIGHLNRGIEAGDGVIGNYVARAEEMIGVQGRVNASVRAGRAETDRLAEAMASVESLFAASAELDGVIAEAGSDLATAQNGIDAAYAERVAKLSELAEAGLALERVQEGYAAAEARRQRDLAALAEEIAAEQRAKEDAAVEEQKRKAAERAEVLRATLLTTGDVVVGSLQASGDALASIFEDTGRSMKGLAKVQAGFQIAGILMDAARASMAALTPPPVGLGPVGGLALLPLIAGQAGLQTAAVATSAAQVKHSGGPVLAPDEVPVTARRGEFVLSPTGRQELGDELLHAANRGEMVTKQDPVTAVLVLNNRIIDLAATEAIRAGGGLRAAVRGARRSGRWSDRVSR